MLLGLTGEVAGVPPQLPVNHSTVSPPLPGVADRVEDAPLQIVDGLAPAPVGTLGRALTVTVTSAHVELTQPLELFFVLA